MIRIVRSTTRRRRRVPRKRVTRSATYARKTRRPTFRYGKLPYGKVGNRRLRGGFLPLLAPLLAAAIGAIPGIVIAAKS